MKAATIALLVLQFTYFTQFGTTLHAQESAAAQQPESSVSNSQPELTVQKAAVDRRLSLVQSQLSSWKFLSVTLSNMNQQLTSVTAPTSQDFDTLEQLIKTRDYQHVKPHLVRLVSAYQSLPLRIQFGFGNQPLDPDVSLVVTDWDAKLLRAYQPVLDDVNSLTRVAFGQEALKAEDLNIKDLRQKLSPEVFKKLQSDLLALLKSDIETVNQNRDNLTKELGALQKQSDEMATKLAKGKLEINQLAIELGLPLFCGTVLMMLSIPIVIQSFSRAAGSAEQVKAIFSSGILVEIITVLLLTMSVLILGLANRIEGPVLGTLLGGISGYVLNRFRGKQQQPSEGRDEPEPPQRA